ncbi:Ribonuclease H-like domain [Phytophthora cactorum]|nr:Ribonuclease H-like domain [Phytophthora cactorum]
MIRVTRPPNPSYTNAQVAGFYFRPCRDQDDERDPRVFSLSLRHEATAAQTGSILNFIRHSSQNLFGWMVWIVQCNLPLSFCESREARRFSNLEPISEERLRAGMDGVVMAVERSIASELPASFGIMLDGWTHASEHYVAVFACYEINGNLKTPMLSMARCSTRSNDDLSAESHLDFLATMLPRDFGVQLVQCRFIVGDNCSVNRRLATLMEVPLVGCASHRLNLAVQDDLAAHEDDLAAVQALMIKLRTLTESAKLRLKTDLRPVIRQQTRWSSTFAMVKRYFELLEFIDVEDDDIMELLPAPAANKRLRVLYQELRDIESVSKALQGRDVDLLDVRKWFDELISVKPHYARFIGPRANIVHSPDFESGGPAAFAATAPADARESLEEQQDSFVERLRKRRRLYEERVEYEQLKSIPPTFNVVERFFSVARVTFGHQRHGLLPRTLETLLFLRENRFYWNASTVDSLQ